MQEKGVNYFPFGEQDIKQVKIWMEVVPTHITIFEGNKALAIYINTLDNSFSTEIKADQYAERTWGSTTELYRRAFNFMKSVTDLYGRSFEYFFMTDSEAMKLWAQDPHKGVDIFDWDEVNVEDYTLKAKKTIIPHTVTSKALEYELPASS